jgi:hypothetical protein
MSINDRIRKMIDILEGGSRKNFALRVGISPQQVYHITAAYGSIGETILSRILLAYPILSPAWLRKEDGTMLTNGTTPEHPLVPKVEPVRKGRTGKRAKKAVAPKEKAVALKENIATADIATEAIGTTEVVESVAAPKKRGRGRGRKTKTVVTTPATATSVTEAPVTEVPTVEQIVPAAVQTPVSEPVAAPTKKRGARRTKATVVVKAETPVIQAETPVVKTETPVVEAPVAATPVAATTAVTVHTAVQAPAPEHVATPAVRVEVSEQISMIGALKELIINNSKLVDSNQQLVDIVLKIMSSKL